MGTGVINLGPCITRPEAKAVKAAEQDGYLTLNRKSPRTTLLWWLLRCDLLGQPTVFVTLDRRVRQAGAVIE